MKFLNHRAAFTAFAAFIRLASIEERLTVSRRFADPEIGPWTSINIQPSVNLNLSRRPPLLELIQLLKLEECFE